MATHTQPILENDLTSDTVFNISDGITTLLADVFLPKREELSLAHEQSLFGDYTFCSTAIPGA